MKVCRVLLVLVPALVLAGGCGGIKRVPVKGKVTYNGKPIEEGEIRFIPLRTDVGPASGSSIKNGDYECAGSKGGVMPGKCKVEITATRLPPGYKQDPNVPFPQKQQYLPEKYNTKSTLEFDVPDKGPVEKNFDLSP
jgi:hypothetical protein